MVPSSDLVVAVADDSEMLQVLWQGWFQSFYGIELAMVAEDGAELVAWLDGQLLDLAVVDQSVAGEGFSVIRQLRELAPAAVLVVISGAIDEAGAIRAGADLALDKADGPSVLEAAMELASERRSALERADEEGSERG